MWRNFSARGITRNLCSLKTVQLSKEFIPVRHLTSAKPLTANEMKYLSQSEATNIDQELFNDYGFSVDQLMELAGLSCAKAIFHLYSGDSLKGKKVLVIAGPGNNGGDGLVCARHLKLFGLKPEVLYPKQSKNEIMQRLVKQTHLMDIEYIDNAESLDSEKLSSYALIVDAIFGFSFHPPIRQPFDKILAVIGDKNAPPIFSIDIPSGWHVEDGPQVMYTDDVEAGQIIEPIQPDVLISLTAPKACARHFRGRVHVLGGRFVPDRLAEKYALDLPSYPSADLFLRL